MNERKQLEENLDSFESRVRMEALRRLAADGENVPGHAGSNINMHCHSFFSYNADGFSPSRIAWESHKAGLYAVALCDFDVLDGLEEFLEAGLILGLRTAVHLETRAYLKEYAHVVVNSPGEPGVTYIMGAGFARKPAQNSQEGKELAGYRNTARFRNVALVKRINPHVREIALDYEKDVLPLTPHGCATERHIVKAYVNRSKSVFQHAARTAKAWAGILEMSFEEALLLVADDASLEEAVRAKLVKRGGVGYEQPSENTFPPADEFIRWAVSCGAIPMITWLDGTSDGEKDGQAMLGCMKEKGAAALNIIPDRNWNISNAELRATKTANLDVIVKAADDMGLPVNIGTEMSRAGLPFVDDLDCAALRRHRDIFLRGARIMTGHTLLLRYGGLSYASDEADAEFGDVSAKNRFFETIGGLPPLDINAAKRLEDMGKQKALQWLRDSI